MDLAKERLLTSINERDKNENRIEHYLFSTRTMNWRGKRVFNYRCGHQRGHPYRPPQRIL